jgi:hypothetical protein
MRRLRLGFGLTRGRAGPAASFSVSITGGSSDSLGTYAQVGNQASIGYVETPTSGSETVKWSNSSNPAAAATYGTGANPTDFTAGDGGTLWLHVTIGAETVSRSLPIRRAPGSFAALTNQSFTDDTGNQTYTYAAATGTGLTWTYAPTGLFTGVTHDAGTRTFTFGTNALAVQSGTVLGVTATDQYGRAATGSPRTFTLAITANIAVNPSFTNLVFADPGNGTPDTITATYTYGGADTLRAFVAIRNGGSALTAAQLRDGTGTFLERVVVNPFSAATFDLTGFTATSNAGTAIDMAIGEVTNGGLSAAQTVAASGLDFTAPTFSSAVPADNATGVTVGSNLVLTFSENIFAGTGSFTLRNVTDSVDTETFNIATGVGSAGGTVSIAGAVVTINPFADLAASKSYAVRWPAGILLDADGNALAANTGDTLYNFTTASSFNPQSLFTGRDGFSVIPSFSTSFESADNSDPAEIPDGVQFQADSSGLGTPRNLSQASATERPLLQQDGSTFVLDFEAGSSQRMSTASYASTSGTNGVTVFVRVKFESVGIEQHLISSDDSPRLWQFRIDASNVVRMICFDAGGGNFSSVSTTTVTTGVWYNICGVFNTTNGRVWINTMTDAAAEGPATNTAGTVNTGSSTVNIGSRGLNITSNTLDGTIAYALCINASLNETDRANLATFASGL